MKRLTWVMGVLLLAAVFSVPGHGEEPRKVERMRQKLAHSQKVLEGIATADYKMIEKHAEELLLIAKEASWKVLDTPAYELYSNEFRRGADDLIEHAKEKNLDAATLSYVELTLTCVKCHKYVREIRRTSFE